MKKLPRSSLSVAAYSAVKDALLSPRYSPGERIAVEELSRALGVSRTPVWDALNRLEAEGLVEIVPRKGVYLLNFTPEKAKEIYVVREALEGMAARLAAERLTERQADGLTKALQKQAACLGNSDVTGYARATIAFHNSIAAITNNRTLERSLQSIYGQVEALRLRTLYLPARLQSSFAEHEAICRALIARDPAQAEVAARRHIQATTVEALQSLTRTKRSGLESDRRSPTREPVSDL